MKKIIICVTFIFVCLFATRIAAEENVFEGGFKKVDYNIKMGNNILIFEKGVYNKNGTTYVSLREICDKFLIPIQYNQSTKEVVIDKYKTDIRTTIGTEKKEEGVIPDKETALAVGKIILEKYAERKIEYETDEMVFYLDVEFFEEYNAWRVIQHFKFKNPEHGAAGNLALPFVVLNKSTGEVMNICTKQTIE